ncbi:MAG: DNA-binding transcriptional MerR regulator [Myxococcota bacterium]|jgi:DNA-binding transcriptional MerR regulator
MSTYATRDVLRLCKLSTHQVRQLVRQGWVTPDRDSRGRLQFDLAMIGRLKRAHQLIQQVPPRRLGAALRRMQGMPNLDNVMVVGGELVISDGTGMWEARTGQVPMDFEAPEYSILSALPVPTAIPVHTEEWTAEDWFELGCDRDGFDNEGAKKAYLSALEMDPKHRDARIGLAGIHEAEGDAYAAISLLESAVADDSGNAVGWQLLGTCLAQAGRDDEALVALDNAIEADPYVADVHEAAADVCTRLGLTSRAAEHTTLYKELAEESW